MNSTTCIFCNTISQTNSKSLVYQNDQVQVSLDDDWAVLGHTLVIFKRHVENVSELTLKEYQTFSETVWKTEQALKKILGNKRFVILKSGGLVSHFHFHIYPMEFNSTWDEIKMVFDKKARVELSNNDRNIFKAQLREVF